MAELRTVLRTLKITLGMQALATRSAMPIRVAFSARLQKYVMARYKIYRSNTVDAKIAGIETKNARLATF